jgi:autotransporter passenger strand-loop-strand repeat protein
MTTTLTASTTAQLNQDIATANAATSGGFIIDLQANITETTQLTAIDLQAGVPLTIDGSDGSGGMHTLNGAGSHGFVVNAGSVTIENLRLTNAVLSGGSSFATVTLANDSFSGNVTIAHNLTVDQIAPVTFNSSTVTNQAGSTYDVGVIGSAFVAGSGGVSRFINKGTLAQTSLAVSGSTGVSNIYVDVTDTGTLSVDGGSNLRFFGAHNSFSGTYVGAGMVDYWTGSINALGTINMTNGACTTVRGAVVNQNGVVTLSVNSTITNSGTWNFTSNNGLALADPPNSSTAEFTLDDASAILAKTGGIGTTVIGCQFNPWGGAAGTIKVATGTLAFNGLVSNFYGPISGAGTFSIGGGGAAWIYAGTTISTKGWTIAQAGTDVTLYAALSYSGFFKAQSGTILTLTPSNDLTLNNSASFASATINGSGALVLAGAHRVTMSGGTIGAGATIHVLSGGTLKLSGTVTDSGTLIADGAASAIVVSGGVLAVQSGGSATGTTVKSGGTEAVQSGAFVTGVISSGGAFELVGVGATSGGLTVSRGATFEFASGYVNSGDISAATPVKVLAGGIQDGGAILSGGVLGVLSDGIVSGVTVESGGKLIVFSRGTGIDFTVDSGGTAINSAGGSLDVVVSATNSGVLVNSGIVNVQNGGTLTLAAATLNNAGSINLPGTLLIQHDVTLSGGGTLSMSDAGLITDSGGGFTLTNVNNKIVGTGALGGDLVLFINNKSGGVINGNGSGTVGALVISATVTNAGLIEGTTSQGLIIDQVPLLTNSGTIGARGTGAFVEIFEVTVANSTTKALIVASGNGALDLLDRATISGGTLKTSAGGQIRVINNTTTFSRVTIAASSLIDVEGTLALSSGTIGAGAIVETRSGATIVSGTVTNGGTLFASSSGSRIEIANGAVVNGGVAAVGDGLVAILGSSSENVSFLSSGNGGLAIADTSGHATAFRGRVSGFGGIAHANKNQFIDLVSVTFSAGEITSSYVPANGANTSGTLFVSSGGVQVAAITMVGHYSAGNFVISAGSSGVVEITDPTVPNGGSVAPAQTFPRQGIDLADIAFGAQTTLVYAENAAGTGGTLTVSDGRHAASIALLGNFIAGSFVAVAGGHGGTLVMQAQPQQLPLLTHPQA